MFALRERNEKDINIITTITTSGSPERQLWPDQNVYCNMNFNNNNNVNIGRHSRAYAPCNRTRVHLIQL